MAWQWKGQGQGGLIETTKQCHGIRSVRSTRDRIRAYQLPCICPPTIFLLPRSSSPLSDIAPHVIVARVRLLVERLLGLGPAGSFKVSCFGRAGRWMVSSVGTLHLWMQDATYWAALPFSPGLEMRSPPSSTGISRLSPAPEAAEPTLMVLPGKRSVTLVSTPESVAGEVLVGNLGEEARWVT